jgi:hypothetical protein
VGQFERRDGKMIIKWENGDLVFRGETREERMAIGAMYDGLIHASHEESADEAYLDSLEAVNSVNVLKPVNSGN